MGNTPGSKPQAAGTANATRPSANGYVDHKGKGMGWA